MANIKDKVKSAVKTVERKALPVAVSACTALSTVAVTAFATEGSGSSSSGVDYSSMASTLTSAFSDIVTQCIQVATAIIPIGIGLIGLGKMWDIAKRFFTKTTSG